MSISNYGELKSELSAYLFHTRLANRYANCTKLFEIAANSRLRVLPMETSALLTTASGTVALPTDYITWRTVKYPSRREYGELDYVHPAYLPSVQLNRHPPVFTIEGNNFITRPVNDTTGAWEFHYYQKIPSLVATPSSDSTTNWLLLEYPNAYLFGVITELAAVQRNAEMAQLYKARRDEAFQEIIQRYAMTTGATSSAVRTATYY